MIGKHWKYLQYVLRHKWYVFVECRKLGLPLWVGLLHDWSKFLPDEWIPYANYFYGSEVGISRGRDETGYYKPGESGDDAFDLAWLKHQHRNPHHWQYWVLIQDDEDTRVLPMPDRYRKEMLADWRGAGRAQGSKISTKEWYLKHRDKMILHPDTRHWIESQLGAVSLLLWLVRGKWPAEDEEGKE
ncbi:MAG: hypothetical protein D6706_15880 [Chloroflexi bacterium]|nr:MAG: hypothetical protein D6706_15880 [Chloroflexota bacterium]